MTDHSARRPDSADPPAAAYGQHDGPSPE